MRVLDIYKDVAVRMHLPLCLLDKLLLGEMRAQLLDDGIDVAELVGCFGSVDGHGLGRRENYERCSVIYGNKY